MDIRSLNGKTVCILGFGKEGKAMLEALRNFAPNAVVTVADNNPDVGYGKRDMGYGIQAGDHWLDGLDQFDVIIKSPGIPPTATLEAHRAKLTNSTQLFLDSIPKKTSVIGVTGTKGKSTVTSLIAAILQKAGKDVQLLGNIGEPAIAHLEQIKPNTIVVQEMSSYQLMDLSVSPRIAVVTSFFPEHLDYHGSLDAYREAKRNIVRFQAANDIAFYSTGAHAEDIATGGKGTAVAVTETDAPVTVEQTHLLGHHNQANIALAWKVAERLGADRSAAVEAIKEFQGLPHRLQFLGTHHGVDWVDDAISTTPQSAVAALDALGDRVATMLLGGQDRGVDFAPLIARLATSQVKNVLLFPGSGPRIATAIEEAKLPITAFPVTSMEEAVKLATLHTPAGNIVLLSPASPSYGMFTNFEEKGDVFAQEIGVQTVQR